MWCVRTDTSTRTPTTPCPCTLPHSPRSRRAAWSTAALWASEASEMAPLPQFHTPTGTDTTATPQTRSSGSHPAACSRSASSTERSEVMPRSLDGRRRRWPGTGRPGASRPGRPGWGGAPASAPAAGAHDSRTVGRGSDDRVEVLEAPHPVAPQGAVDDLVALRRAPGSTTSMRRPVQLVAGQLLRARACGPAGATAMCALLTCSTSAGPVSSPSRPWSPPCSTRSCSRPRPGPRPGPPPPPPA